MFPCDDVRKLSSLGAPNFLVSRKFLRSLEHAPNNVGNVGELEIERKIMKHRIDL